MIEKTKFVVALVTAALLVGCNRQLPAIKPPKIDVVAAANGAIAEFDTDGDGAISKSEACTGMRESWPRYDRDEDGVATAEEIQERFSEWGKGSGMINLPIDVSFRGRPLPDAKIAMTPFEFLGDHFKPATGKTDPYGSAFMEIPREHLPKHLQMAYGVQTGLYRIEITHPNVDLRPKYNTETELSVDLKSDSNVRVRFDLK